MYTKTEPTISMPREKPDDARLSALPNPASVRPPHTCAHCRQFGTTACGALWRESPHAESEGLYYLHSRCVAPYKVAYGLWSVEGRIPHDQHGASPAPARAVRAPRPALALSHSALMTAPTATQATQATRSCRE